MPRKPDPNHPMHQAAAAENREIDDMVSPGDPPAPSAPPEPTSTPAPRIDPPAPSDAPPRQEPVARPNPPGSDNFTRLSAQLDSALGRLEASNREMERLRTEAQTGQANRVFLEQRANELGEENKRLTEKVRELASRADLVDATRGFQSELVDPDHFAEIYRGLSPQFQRMNDALERVNAALSASDKRYNDLSKEVDERVKKERQKLMDKLLLRDVPDLGALMDRQDFQDFLAERIPGTRRTRSQEFADAYEDGDTTYMTDLVKEFRERSAPPPPDPGMRVGQRTPPSGQPPQAPKEPPLITEEDLQAKHQEVLRGETTMAEYRKLSAAYKAQQVPKAA